MRKDISILSPYKPFGEQAYVRWIREVRANRIRKEKIKRFHDKYGMHGCTVKEILETDFSKIAPMT